MYYYDQDGEIKWTRDQSAATRSNILSALASSRYGLDPDAAGKLQRLLGPGDPQKRRKEAEKEVRRALRKLGLEEAPVSSVAQALDEGWRIALDVST